MATPVIIPRQGQSVESCILTEWKVKPGDSVSEGDVLAVIETDKASFDLESTASGTVLELFWEADDDVPVLANVLAIGEEGENVDEFRPDNGASLRLNQLPLLVTRQFPSHLLLKHRLPLNYHLSSSCCK